jgi:Fic family protein
MNTLTNLQSINLSRFDRVDVLKKLATASRALAELKGLVKTIPNQSVLIGMIGLQEAKFSSEIENIVTTNDELFSGEISLEAAINSATKEVLRYGKALHLGFDLVQSTGLITINHMIAIQSALEQNNAGFRALPGTALKDGDGRVIYTPPQDPREIISLMSSLEQFINDSSSFEIDPLIKMALIHHQFESIHPFYDGNGRTGRIINVLYLVKEGLLDNPVVYLSGYIVRNKPAYYALLQSAREDDSWEDWVLYMLDAVEKSSVDAIMMVQKIQVAMRDYKMRIRQALKFYSQDLIDALFRQPYTKIELIERALHVSRLTATGYLNALVEAGFLEREKRGRSYYYINKALRDIAGGA